MTNQLPNFARRGPGGTPLQYLIALAIVLVALAVRFAMRGFFAQYAFPFICFFPAVLAAAFLTSLGPSLFASALSVALAWYFFIEPAYAWVPLSRTDLVGLCFFASVLIVDCVVIHMAKQSAQNLRIAQLELRAADAKKNEFLAFMAHELRNPLNIIKNSGKLLSSNADDKSQRWLSMQNRQVAQMDRLIGDLLDGARLAAGKLHVEAEPVDLAAVVTRAVEAFRLITDERTQTIALIKTSNPIPILGDAARLTQIVENLLSNASKFSPANSTITVTLETDGKCAILAVADEGNGLEPEALENIFGMYVQTKASDAKLGGLGLGLPLARHIAQRHGGTLKATSPGKGRGAIFTLSLPLEKP